MFEYKYNTDPSFVLNDLLEETCDLLDLFVRLDIRIFAHLDRRHLRLAFGNHLFHHGLNEVTFADCTESRNAGELQQRQCPLSKSSIKERNL